MHWRPEANCDGQRAADRALWLERNQRLTRDAARHQVMREYPQMFQGSGSVIPGWNPNANCDGQRAEDRALWLQKNQRMTQHAAQQQVMREFPQMFQGSGSVVPGWNPNANCDGQRAEDRALWLQRNQNMTQSAAQQQVVREFPTVFQLSVSAPPGWNPNANCDGEYADDRAVWLQRNASMTPYAAQQQVMREFPQAFNCSGSAPPGWNPNANCEGIRAEERALWLQQTRNMAQHAAQQQVMLEYPSHFNGGMVGGMGAMGMPSMVSGMRSTNAMGGMHGGMGYGMDKANLCSPWNPNAMCDGERAEDRAIWLQNNKGITPLAAQQQVMCEYPSQFGSGMNSMGAPAMGGGMGCQSAMGASTMGGGMGAMGAPAMGGGMSAMGGPSMGGGMGGMNAMSGSGMGGGMGGMNAMGATAMGGGMGGMNAMGAPAMGGGMGGMGAMGAPAMGGGMTGSSAMGAPAMGGGMGGMSEQGAPAIGGSGGPGAKPMFSPAMAGLWKPDAMCGDMRAEERVLWLQQNEGLTVDAAQIKVMREHPLSFIRS